MKWDASSFREGSLDYNVWHDHSEWEVNRKICDCNKSKKKWNNSIWTEVVALIPDVTETHLHDPRIPKVNVNLFPAIESNIFIFQSSFFYIQCSLGIPKSYRWIIYDVIYYLEKCIEDCLDSWLYEKRIILSSLPLYKISILILYLTIAWLPHSVKMLSIGTNVLMLLYSARELLCQWGPICVGQCL